MSDTPRAGDTHIRLHEPTMRVSVVEHGTAEQRISVLFDAPPAHFRGVINGAFAEITVSMAHRWIKQLERGISLAESVRKVPAVVLAFLLASTASGQACGTYFVKLAESQCGQTLTAADSLFAIAYGITADELRMVDTYVSGQTVNQCASVWKVMAHEPERCPPVDRPLLTKVRVCP